MATNMIMTQTEVAEMLKISAATMRMWIRSKPDLLPPCFNIGSAEKPMLRFMREDVIAHINKLSVDNQYTFASEKKILDEGEIPIVEID